MNIPQIYSRVCLIFAFAFFPAWAFFAQANDSPSSIRQKGESLEAPGTASSDVPDERWDGAPESLSLLVVYGDPAEPTLEITTVDALTQTRVLHLGKALEDLPGIAFARRGTDIYDPQIRGLGFDRVVTLVNGIPLLHATPTRTGAPVNMLGPGSVDGVSLSKGLVSVTLGPPASGGYIEANTFVDTPISRSGRPFSGAAYASLHPNRGGYSAAVEGRWRDATWEGIAAAYTQDLRDYRAGDGREVPADFRGWGASAGLRWRPADRHELEWTGIWQRIRFQENPSLPLDTRDTESAMTTLRHQWRPDGAALERLSWSLGYAVSEPFLTIENRPVQPAPIRAVADSGTWNLRIDSDWRASPLPGALQAGLQATQSLRDTTRYRGPAVDRIWPDVRSRDLGAYLQWRGPVGAATALRLGARYDHVRSEARATAAPAFGLPVIEQYARYNGPSARRAETTHHAGALNLVLDYRASDTWRIFGGAGWSRRPPRATELWRAFLPALGGGFELGNPTLDAEDKTELVAGAEFDAGRLHFQTEVFLYFFSNYIHRLKIGATPAPPPPVPGTSVFGYRNIDAVFHGWEGRGYLRLADGFSLPFSFGWVRAENRRTGNGIADVPPWQASAGLNRSFQWGRHSLDAGLDLTYVDARRNPAPEENPIYVDSPAHTTLDVHLAWRFDQRFALHLQVDNVLDSTVFPYLSPPASAIPGASGDLAPNTRIPAPGISPVLSLEWQW